MNYIEIVNIARIANPNETESWLAIYVGIFLTNMMTEEQRALTVKVISELQPKVTV